MLVLHVGLYLPRVCGGLCVVPVVQRPQDPGKNSTSLLLGSMGKLLTNTVAVDVDGFADIPGMLELGVHFWAAGGCMSPCILGA